MLLLEVVVVFVVETVVAVAVGVDELVAASASASGEVVDEGSLGVFGAGAACCESCDTVEVIAIAESVSSASCLAALAPSSLVAATVDDDGLLDVFLSCFFLFRFFLFLLGVEEEEAVGLVEESAVVVSFLRCSNRWLRSICARRPGRR